MAVTQTEPRWAADVGKYLFAAGFIASTEAISNVVTVERTFHAHLTEFRPSPKFWSVKVLVSIAFLQETALYLTSYSDLQQRLIPL